MKAQTPINILDDLMPLGSEYTAIRQSLRWDYSQLGDAAAAVREHAVQIKVSERRANDAVIEAGRHLIAVRDTLQHGQWMDWLQTEFAMSDRTAQTLMSIANRFDGKSEIISDLSTTVLGLLAAPSVPDAAVDAVIDASANGKVTVVTAKTIIQQHKPAKPARSSGGGGGGASRPPTRTYESGLPALDMPKPTAAPANSNEPQPVTLPTKYDGLYKSCVWINDGYTLTYSGWSPAMTSSTRFPDYTSLYAFLDSRLPVQAVDDRPLPAWVTAEPEPTPTPATPPDDRITRAQRLIELYRETIASFDDYGDLIGAHTETLAPQRELEKLIRHLERETRLLHGETVPEDWSNWTEVAA